MQDSGQYIADYQIVKPLSENQVYQTYLVSHPAEGVARLLLVNAGQLPDLKSRQVFLDRGRAFLGRSFPGVCALLEVEIAEEGNFCLYQKPSGLPLAERLQDALSVRQALELIRQIAIILKPLHDAGLWHGHLSPATINLDVNAPVLVDSGLSSLLKLDFQSGVDPRYSSPELVRGETIAAPADIYSLGILLYRLLAGREPFHGKDPFAVAMQQVQGDMPPLPEQFGICQPLVDALLQGATAERMTAGQLVDASQQLLDSPTIDLLQPVANEPGAAVAEDAEETSAQRILEIERVVSESELSSRIEARLQERAGILQQSAHQVPDAERANSARMIAAGKQYKQIEQNMNVLSRRNYRPVSRFLMLTVTGVAIGVVLYQVFFGSGKAPQQESRFELPAAVTQGLTAGDKLLEQGDFSRAEQLFTKLIRDYPTYPQPYNNLAAVYAVQGEYEKARTFLERGMATDSSYETVYRNLSAIYAEMARDSYGKALQLAKGQQTVKLQVLAATGGTTPLMGKAVAPAPTSPPPQQAAPVQQPVVATGSQSVPSAAGPSSSVPATTSKPPAEPVSVAPQQETLPPETQALVKESPEAFLQRWAAAWAAQDVEVYLNFYGEEFVPAAGNSRAAWEKQRRSRLTRPESIKVVLSDFALAHQTDEQLQIELTQDYQSDHYSDRSRKVFTLKAQDDSWVILREQTLGRVR